MEVNSYQQYRREYIRLSTAINRGKQKGLDISELLAQREQLKNVYSIQQNDNESIQKYTIKNKQRKQTSNSIQIKQSKQLEIVNQLLTNQLSKILNEVKEIKEQIINGLNEHFKELKQLQKENRTNERKTELENIKRDIKDISKQLSNQIQPANKPKAKSIKTFIPKKNFSSETITLMFNQELGNRIKNFLNQNSQSFPSVSHFVRAGLLAYQKGMKINRDQQFSGNFTKRNLRVDKELKEIYQNLPEGQKSLVFNQILTSFLATN